MVSRVMKSLEDRGFVQTQPDGSMLVRENVVFAN
jgi:CRP/FNR family cyclic AMP-dependent transcriptional regulator